MKRNHAQDASDSDLRSSNGSLLIVGSLLLLVNDPTQIRKDLQQCMQLNFSVFREGDAMAQGMKELGGNS